MRSDPGGSESHRGAFPLYLDDDAPHADCLSETGFKDHADPRRDFATGRDGRHAQTGNRATDLRCLSVSDAALDRLREWKADVAIVLGSGLNVLVSDATPENGIPYSEFGELPKPSVPGHVGRFVFGKMGNARMIFAQGRVHLYEGHSAKDITAGIRLLAAAGIKPVIL